MPLGASLGFRSNASFPEQRRNGTCRQQAWTNDLNSVAYSCIDSIEMKIFYFDPLIFCVIYKVRFSVELR